VMLRLAPAAVCAALTPFGHAQDAKPANPGKGDKTTIAVDAKLVVVPAVVYDKKGLVTTLTQNDFAITVDGKPQTIRYFDRDTDLPLTVGLLVDTSRSQQDVLDAEQKASEKFLDSFLHPAGPGRPADKAFILQFAHSAELLQDVTDSRPLLAAGLKEIGTQAPGSADEDTTASTQNPNSNNAPNGGGNNPGSNPGNNGGYGPYGRHGGYPGGGGGGGNNGGSYGHGDRASGGTVLYDSVYLASGDLLSKQKGRRALIVLTDGVDRHSKESLTEAIEAAQRADTVVYAIYYKGHDDRGFQPHRSYGGGGYDPYGRYPPTTGGSTDPGTYRDPDGRKILTRICAETGGRMFELKGKGSVDDIYKQIGEELRAQYRLGFTPTFEAASAGYHPIQLTLTNPADRKLEVQTRDGYYTGPPKNRD
ncbi:MAG TPA: VWA domain-containing protein, partial [Acidobacteriaceae bacterium]|nr:VWA domain-containing protein [Acidobacteriaceae bacterium]